MPTVGYWTEQVAQGVDDAVSSQKETLLDLELENFLEHTTGGAKKSQGFSSVFRSQLIENRDYPTDVFPLHFHLRLERLLGEFLSLRQSPLIALDLAQ